MQKTSSNIPLLSIIGIVFLLPINTSILAAQTKTNITSTDAKINKTRAKTHWPESNAIDAWDDEEFENDDPCDETTTETNSIINFEYLLNCVKQTSSTTTTSPNPT